MTDIEAVAIGSGMKLTCSRDELSQKLAVVARAVSARTTVLVLGGILLRAENGELHLAATDMELSLRTSLEAQVDGDGAVVVPGKMLVDLIRLLPDEDVQIEHRAEEGVVRIDGRKLGATELRQPWEILRVVGVDAVARAAADDLDDTFTLSMLDRHVIPRQ